MITERIKGEIADYYLNEEGILFSYSKSVVRTVENISDNLALVKEITGGKKVPLLIYLTPAPMPDKATRKFSSEHVGDNYSAMAMVSNSGVENIILRLLFSIKKSPIPIKAFSDDAAALKWLRSLK